MQSLERGLVPSSRSLSTFSSLKVSNLTHRAIDSKLGFKDMTEVQDKSIPVILQGIDAFVKAKTGTGKTLAFLIPAFETMSKHGSLKGKGTQVVIISPTRDLAFQIAKEAEILNTFHKFSIMTAVGGTNVNTDYRKIRAGAPDMMIATPGRLKALLESSQEEGHELDKKIRSIRMAIFDEGDTLFDMGFRRDILSILEYFPSARQSILYSATLPQPVLELARQILRPDNVLIDAVGQVVDQTHDHVDQKLVVTSLDQQVAVIEKVLSEHIKRVKDHKVLVFFSTAREAGFMVSLFEKFGFKPLEIHSRKSQSARNKASADFRSSKSAIMFSSDVSARGMDYPDISLIIQVGMVNRDQYIQRLGRTGRAGKSGEGVLIVSDFEERTIRKALAGIPINDVSSAFDSSSQVDLSLVPVNKELEKNASRAYLAWLGYYNSQTKLLGWDKVKLVEIGAKYSSSIGLREVPLIEKSTAKKMGLFGIANLRIAPKGAQK